MSARHPRVAITGCGYVGAAGCGPEAMAATFLEGPRLSEVDRGAGYHRPDSARHAVLVGSETLAEHLSPRRARRMSPPSRFAVVAARLAWEKAGLELGAGGDHTSVITSTAYGPSSYTEELLRQILLGDPTQASPFLFTEAVANAPAAQIALLLKARGANITVTQRESGPLIALAKGAAQIRSGRAEQVVVASVEEANPLLHAVLDRFGVLAGSRGGEEVARPFDRDRRGFHLGEGATAVVLESLDRARSRRVPVLGVLGPCIGAFDSGASRAGYGHGVERLSERLRGGLEQAGLRPESFQTVVSGTSGGRMADELEAGVLRFLWPDGESMPPVFVPKASTAEHGGGLLAGLLAALEGARVAPTPGYVHPAPELGMEPFVGGRLPDPERVLVSALSVGGSAAWMVVETAET